MKNIQLNSSDTGNKLPKSAEISETPSAGDISEQAILGGLGKSKIDKLDEVVNLKNFKDIDR